MQQPAKNSLSILGIGVVLLSLGSTWFVFQEVPVNSEALEMLQSLMGGSGPLTYSGTISGFDGSVLYVPIWIIVLLISAAHVLQLMDATDFFYVPKIAKWITLSFSLFFPSFAIVFPLFNSGTTPSWGPHIAWISAAIATLTLMLPTESTVPPTPAEKIEGSHLSTGD